MAWIITGLQHQLGVWSVCACVCSRIPCVQSASESNSIIITVTVLDACNRSEIFSCASSLREDLSNQLFRTYRLSSQHEEIRCLQRQILNPLRRLLNTLVDLVCVGTLTDSRGRARLATRLAADNGSHGTSPLGAIAALGLEWLVDISNVFFHNQLGLVCLPLRHNTRGQPCPPRGWQRTGTNCGP